MDVKILPIVKPATPRFYALQNGKVFIAGLGNVVYQKIAAVEDNNGKTWNAVACQTGQLHFFRGADEVRLPKQAELRIEE